MSAATAITEEVLVNGYLNTRLYQLGWSPRASLLLSLTLRTSYHIYYGIGFLLHSPPRLLCDEVVSEASQAQSPDHGALSL